MVHWLDSRGHELGTLPITRSQVDLSSRDLPQHLYMFIAMLIGAPSSTEKRLLSPMSCYTILTCLY